MTYEEASRRQAEALRDKKGVRILALETSCDETAAAVIEDGRKILSNIVFSQIFCVCRSQSLKLFRTCFRQPGLPFFCIYFYWFLFWIHL